MAEKGYIVNPQFGYKKNEQLLVQELADDAPAVVASHDIELASDGRALGGDFVDSTKAPRPLANDAQRTGF